MLQQTSHATALSEAHSVGNAALSCGQSRLAVGQADEDTQSYGAVSPRAARSQISTAVSFEGARPAGSAAVAARSADEDSAHSFADPEGENSSVPVLGQAGHHFLAQPTTSLLSTAVRNASPPPRAPGSPDLYRASSVVSHTEAGQPGHAQRAGTPASVYAQGRVISLPATRANSPQGSQADEQYSESEGGRHSRSSKLYRALSYQSNAEVRGQFGHDSEAAQKLSNQVNGKLSLEPPEKKMRLNSAVHGQLRGFGSPEMANRGVRGGVSAQSTRKPHLPLSKANSKQAESALAEKSPRLSPVRSVERQFQGRPSNLPAAHRYSRGFETRQHQVFNPFRQTPLPDQPQLGHCTVAGTPPPGHTILSTPAGPPTVGHSPATGAARPEELVDMLLEGESSHGRSSSGHKHVAVGPQAAEHHAPWEGFSLERSSVPRLKESKPEDGRKTSLVPEISFQAASARTAGEISPLDSSQAQLPALLQPPGMIECLGAEEHHQDSAQPEIFEAQPSQGLHQADSVLGTLLLEDGGSEIDAQDNLHSLQSTHSANGLHEQQQQQLGDPSYQASIIPHESANGDAPAAVRIGALPEKQGSVASGLANSQLATQHGGILGARNSTSIQAQDEVEGRKTDKQSHPHKAESQMAAPCHPLEGLKVSQPKSKSQEGHHKPTGVPLSAELEARHSSGNQQDNALMTSNSISRLHVPPHSEAGAAAPNLQLLPDDEAALPEARSHREQSYSSGRPAVAVVDHNADGAAAASDVVAQSHPAPNASLEQGAPRPALTVFMQEGLVGPGTEPDDGAAWPDTQQELGFSNPGSDVARAAVATRANSGASPSGRSRRDASKRRKTNIE